MTGGFEALEDGEKRAVRGAESVAPQLVFNRGRMCCPWEALYHRLASVHRNAWLSYHPELRFLGTKWGSEQCLQEAEENGINVARPETFLVPKGEIASRLRVIGRKHPLIFKPAEGFQGRGILVSTPEDFDSVARQVEQAPEPRFVVQRIVENPILLDGKRFDIRVYALVTSFAPLRYEVYAGGMARVAAKAVPASGGADLLSTITNCDFRIRLGESLENLTLPQLLGTLRALGWDVQDFWPKVEDLIGKLFEAFAAWKPLLRIPDLSRHFLIAGVDLLLTEVKGAVEPVFIESNHSGAPLKDYSPKEVDEGLWLTNRRWLTALLNGGVPALDDRSQSLMSSRPSRASTGAGGRPAPTRRPTAAENRIVLPTREERPCFDGVAALAQQPPQCAP